MKAHVRSVVAIALVGVLAAAARAPEAQQDVFEPTVGQPGKDVIWVPTPDALVEQMLDLARLTSTDYLIDLGSGDGRTVIAAARRGARAHGIEFNPDMVALSRRLAREAGVTTNATFREADIFESDLSEATVITMFLLPRLNMKLRPTLLDLEPGTRIVSNSFHMQDWEPDETVRAEEDCATWCTASLWIVPAQVAGQWPMPDGVLDLAQEFQEVSGTLDGIPLTDVTLRGDRLSFRAGTIQYTATVSGDTMRGTGGPSGAWTASRE